MPLYDYECPNGHEGERLMKLSLMDGVVTCVCGEPMTRVMSLPAKQVDGIYSYAPNLGCPKKFERQHEEAKAKKR